MGKGIRAGFTVGYTSQGPSQQVMNLQTLLVFQLSFRGRIWAQLLSTRGQESTQVDVVHVVLTEGDDRRHGQGCAEGSTVNHRQAESLKTPLALSLFPGVDVGVHWRRDAGLRPGLMKTWWVGRRKQHRQVYDGRA